MQNKDKQIQSLDPERRRAERVSLEVPVEFIVDADLVKARSVDLSETGLRFSTEKAIPILLRMTVDGEQQEHRGQLVWARRDHHGHMDYGLEFIADDEEIGVIPDIKT